MAINYEKVGWDTTKYINPSNMNHMDEGIKAACDKADANEAAIADVNSNLSPLTLNLGVFDDNISLENHLKNIFLNILPTDVFCHGQFVWKGNRIFEAFVYGNRDYGYIKSTNWNGDELSIVCDNRNFYYIDSNSNNFLINVTENISSYVDTYANSDGVFINVSDSRIKRSDTISNVELFDCYGRGTTTYDSVNVDAVYDGGFVISVKNLNHIGNYLYRVRYNIKRKQV